MPTITATPATVWAHCRDSRCPGNNQEELNGFREETAWTLGENGGDGAFFSMIEKSIVEYRVADEADSPCGVCSEPREISGSPRPTYQPLSGHDPLGLIGGPAFNPNVQNTDQDAKIAELQATVNRLAALLEPEVDA